MMNMSVTPARGTVRTKSTWLLSLLCAGMFLVMLMTQLYGYEAFSGILSQLHGGSEKSAMVLAAVIVTAELLALPYLLSMYISRLFRFFSAALAFFVSGFWLFTAFTNAHASNAGLFSDTFELAGGLLVAVWSMVLFGAVCWVLMADSKFKHATS